jgi:phosphate transport system protein
MREHISGQYDAELDELRAMVTEMGGLVERQLSAVCEGLATWNADPAEPVIALDKAVNRLEVRIDDACTHIIAKRQPTASDLRLVMSIVKAITDLERIGDETTRIAKMLETLCALPPLRDPLPELTEMMTRVQSMLADALNAFVRVDEARALDVITRDRSVDRAYQALVERLLGEMDAHPAQLRSYHNVIWCARSFERIGDHAKNVGEYIIYLARGQDVRHQGLGAPSDR